MIELREYTDDDCSRTVLVNPSEIAAIREWKYHSFRSAITEIVLQCGEKIRVWETIDVVRKKVAET